MEDGRLVAEDFCRRCRQPLRRPSSIHGPGASVHRVRQDLHRHLDDALLRLLQQLLLRRRLADDRAWPAHAAAAAAADGGGAPWHRVTLPTDEIMLRMVLMVALMMVMMMIMMMVMMMIVVMMMTSMAIMMMMVVVMMMHDDIDGDVGDTFFLSPPGVAANWLFPTLASCSAMSCAACESKVMLRPPSPPPPPSLRRLPCDGCGGTHSANMTSASSERVRASLSSSSWCLADFTKCSYKRWRHSASSQPHTEARLNDASLHCSWTGQAWQYQNVWAGSMAAAGVGEAAIDPSAASEK